MTNERLRAAILNAGLTVEDLSTRIGVDPKTVERWITTNRTPYRAHRMAAAIALGRDEPYLWPATESDPRSVATSTAEVIAVHPNRGSVPIRTWIELIENTRESIDFLAFAASFLHDVIPDLDDLMRRKARQGVQSRLLFGDPSSDAVRIRGDEETINELLAARCHLTWNYFASILNEDGVTARKHSCTVYNSLYRSDDTLLVNTHTFGAPASQSPMIHVDHIPGGRLFTSYMLGFERTWAQGCAVASAAPAA